MRLSEKTGNKDNNFNLLRLAAATFVLVHHAYALAREDDKINWIVGEMLGSAVPIFIIISGFLVTRSWTSNPRPLAFIMKRLARIIPALACSVLVAVLVIGPLVTSVDLGNYFSSPLTALYLKSILLYPNPIYHLLPGVFEHNPFPFAVNGSLWTLPIEVFLYGVLLCLGLARVLTKRFLLLLIVLCLISAEQYFKMSLTTLFLTMQLGSLIQLAIFFCIGALYCLYFEKIRVYPWLAVLLFPIFLVANKLPFADAIRYLVLPYLVLCCAYVEIAPLRFFQRFDVSYGVYVYAFPVQQMVIYYLFDKLETYAQLGLSFVIVLVVSYLSWRYVERPCLTWSRHAVSKITEESVSLQPG